MARPKTKIVIAVVIVGLLFSGACAAEAVVINGVTVMASSEEKPQRLAANLVNGSGFDRNTLTVTDTTANTMWNSLAHETRETVWIMFDLGEVRYVAEIWVYNYNRDNPMYRKRRFLTADVWCAQDNNITTYNPTDATPCGWTKVINDQEFTEAPYTEHYNTPTIIAVNRSARYFVLNDAVSQGSQRGEKYEIGLFGLSEVIFLTTSKADTRNSAVDSRPHLRIETSREKSVSIYPAYHHGLLPEDDRPGRPYFDLAIQFTP